MKDRVTPRKGGDITADLVPVFLVEERIETRDHLYARGFREHDSDTGVVYFIQAEDGPIKIGFTSRPIKQRLSALQSTNAKRLTLLATVGGNRELEQRMHYWFKNGRIHGEWFEADSVGLRELIVWAQSRLAF